VVKTKIDVSHEDSKAVKGLSVKRRKKSSISSGKKVDDSTKFYPTTLKVTGTPHIERMFT